MKTTIDIADVVLRRAKQLAVRRGTTLKAVIEDALRLSLEQEARVTARPGGAISTHTFQGRGLQPGMSWGDWASLRAVSYEGRGG